MKHLFKLTLGAITFLASSNPGFAQGPPATVLEIDGANTVFYDNDVTDYSKLATNPNTTTPTDANNFLSFIGISDIVAVNGQPAKGTWVVRATVIFLRTEPMLGQASQIRYGTPWSTRFSRSCGPTVEASARS